MAQQSVPAIATRVTAESTPLLPTSTVSTDTVAKTESEPHGSVIMLRVRLRDP